MKSRPLEWLLGGSAFVVLACCAVPALATGTVLLVGGVVLGSSVLVIAGVALALVGIKRRRQARTVFMPTSDTDTDARIS